MMKGLKCIWVTEDVDIGLLRPATLPLAITEVIIVATMVEVDLGHKRPDTIYLKILEFIIMVLMVEVELGLKRPSTLPLTIVDKELTLKRDMDIGLRTATLPHASQEVVVDFWVSSILLLP